jgi:WhiB family redox-sensing transcriptional regulator
VKVEALFEGLNVEWMKDANCARMDVDLFFPEVGLPYNLFAKEVCATCPVSEECLWFSNETSSDYGMWGGLSPMERRRWRKQNDIGLGDSREHYEWKTKQRYLHRPIEEWA